MEENESRDSCSSLLAFSPFVGVLYRFVQHAVARVEIDRRRDLAKLANSPNSLIVSIVRQCQYIRRIFPLVPTIHRIFAGYSRVNLSKSLRENFSEGIEQPGVTGFEIDENKRRPCILRADLSRRFPVEERIYHLYEPNVINRRAIRANGDGI